MKHKLAFFTSTRSNMTILEPLLNEINKSKSFEYLLFVHGTHLEKNYGKTIRDIKKLNFKINSKFFSVNKLDNEFGLVMSLEMTQKGVNRIFNKYKFDSVMILGDRIERLPVVAAALAYRKFIFHIHGGEITTGALDDQVRHMITKSAHLHFTICEKYSRNILNMAEEKFRVHNVGSLGVEKILNSFKKEKKNNRVILTYHPETLRSNFSWNRNFLKIVNELNKFNFKVIITSPGHEKGSKNQINFIKKIIKNKKKFSFVKSLGVNGYFKTLKKSLFVIGNSSSGIIEVPYYRIPTINIGLRQNGRFFHKSIIQCNTSSFSIRKSILIANSKIFRDKIKNMKLHFGNGGASKKILNIIKKYSKDKNKLLNKQFQN